MKANDFIQLHPLDNVVIALKDLEASDPVNVNGVTIAVRSFVGFGHKLAIREIEEGTKVLKYGLPIGIATTGIHAGEHVHSHNLRTDYPKSN